MTADERGPRAPDPLRFLLDIAQRVPSGEELEVALSTLIEGLAQLQGWDVAEAWVRGGDGRSIDVGAWWVREASLEPFMRDGAGQGYQPDRGIVRRAWESQHAVWYDDLAALPRSEFLRWEVAERLGLRSGLLAPIVAGEQTLAVLLLFGRQRRARDEDGLRLVRAAAAQVAWLLERRLQLQAKVRVERGFRTLFADNPLPMWVFDTTTLAFLAVNEAAVAQYGYSRSEFLDRTILDIRPHEDRRAALELVTRERPALSRTSWRHIDAHGRVFEVEVTSHATSFDGREARLVVAQDISERRRAEREREDAAKASEAALERSRLSEERFRAMFEQSPLAICVTSPEEGRFLDANPRFVAMAGYDRSAILEGSSVGLGLWFEPGERRRFVEALRRAGSVRAFPSRFRHRDGRMRHIAISATVIEYGGNRALLSLIEDLTHQRELEVERERQAELLRRQAAELERRVSERTAQLSAVNRELEGFSYSVSHDLRAPLRAIDGFSLALLQDYGDGLDERGWHYLERVRGATQRMGRLIDDLLALSRVGRSQLVRQSVDLAELARAVVDELREADPERTVEVVLPDTATVSADRNLLRLVLQNLIGNAWKFTAKAERPHVELRLDEQGAERVVTVADNGAGFDVRYADQLFVPFQRLHSVDEFPGTGIGLATVRRIVQRHGGRVWAEGEVGRGAAFHVTLGEGKA